MRVVGPISEQVGYVSPLEVLTLPLLGKKSDTSVNRLGVQRCCNPLLFYSEGQRATSNTPSCSLMCPAEKFHEVTGTGHEIAVNNLITGIYDFNHISHAR